MTADVAQSTDLPVNYIGSFFKKYGVNHGIAIIDNGNKSSSKKATQSYRLYSEGEF
jgi:hypothetical protein